MSELTQEAMAQYEKLVQEVRMRQHDLGNQLSVIKNISSGDANRYLEELNKDQRHNVLLLCGDLLLAGLLYLKCMEAEAKGITVESHVSARLGDYALSQHELIAIVGGLLDNAIDAELKEPETGRRIRIVVDTEDGRYRITVANRYPYVPYETIHGWFQAGKSSKGEGRGLGLAHAKKICETGKADIAYGNQETEGENEVFFMLYLEKAGGAEEIAGTEGEREAEKQMTDAGNRRSSRRLLVFCGVCALLFLGVTVFWLFHQKGESGHIADGSEEQFLVRTEAETWHVANAPQYARLKAAWGNASAPDTVQEFHPYLMHDETHEPEGSEENTVVRLPERLPCSGTEGTLKPAAVTYEIYDEQGHRIGRDTFVSYDMDSAEDKGQMVKRGQKLIFHEGEYYRRIQERWEFDESGREIAYRKYKQYGEQLKPELAELTLYTYDGNGSRACTITGNGDNDTFHICDLNDRGQLIRQYELDRNDNILCLTEYSYEKDGYPLKDDEGSQVWDAAHSRVHITDTDYYGNRFEYIYDLDADGRRTDGFYLRDGVWYRGYEATIDVQKRLVEEYDNMPALLKGRVPDAFRDTYYDEECTLPRLPQANNNRYRYYMYNEDGTEAYLLDINGYYGYGDLWVYCRGESGEPVVTYDFRIWADRLPDFVLEMPQGGHMYFDNAFYDYIYYEKHGSGTGDRRYYLTLIGQENAAGKLQSLFRFDREGPVERKSEDHSTDWTVEISIQ